MGQYSKISFRVVIPQILATAALLALAYWTYIDLQERGCLSLCAFYIILFSSIVGYIFYFNAKSLSFEKGFDRGFDKGFATCRKILEEKATEQARKDNEESEK